MSEVLYRKHRPQLFADVYGQDHIKTILSQSLSNNRVAHAYVFAGPRGSGKTTVARILSKELGIEGVDLIEIDAASHRGIDDIRGLRDSVQFQPTQGSRKMYILDEVHMLTNEAFNALLKTLEEPPDHAYFVLCTTEPQKIPATIMSRSIQLPFKPATMDELSKFIAHFAKVEGVQLSKDSIQLLAEHADGAFRDALVLLEKVISLNHTGVLEPIIIINGLGLVSTLHVSDMMSKIEQKDTIGLLKLVDSLYEQNVDLVEIMNKLLVRLSKDVVSDVSNSVIGDSSLYNHKIIMLKALISAREQMSILKDPRVALVAHITDLCMSQSDLPQVDTPHAIASVDVNSTISTHDSKSDVSHLSDWERVLLEVHDKNSSVEALLKDSRVQTITDDYLVLEFPFAFHKSKIESPGNRVIVEEAVSKVYQKKLTIQCILKDDDSSSKPSPYNDVAPAPTELSSDDLLAQAQEVFGGQMIE